MHFGAGSGLAGRRVRPNRAQQLRMLKLLFLSLCSFVGGLFLGFLFHHFGAVVLSLAKEGFQRPKEFGVAAIVLIAIFLPAVVYIPNIIFGNEWVFLGACVSFGYLVYLDRLTQKDRKDEPREP